MSEITIGIDEAGRSPVIGPLVQAAVCCTCSEDFEKLKQLGVTDSKKLTPRKRRNLAAKIRLAVHVELFLWAPFEIDHSIHMKRSINLLEVDGIGRLIPKFKQTPTHLAIHRVQKSGIPPEGMETLLKLFPETTIDIIDNEADNVAVAAASIIATDHRTWIMDQIKLKYPDIGSGEPRDRKTIAFIRKYLANLPSIVRSEWATVNKIRSEADG
jgi:ribonuclease HII